MVGPPTCTASGFIDHCRTLGAQHRRGGIQHSDRRENPRDSPRLVWPRPLRRLRRGAGGTRRRLQIDSGKDGGDGADRACTPADEVLLWWIPMIGQEDGRRLTRAVLPTTRWGLTIRGRRRWLTNFRRRQPSGGAALSIRQDEAVPRFKSSHLARRWRPCSPFQPGARLASRFLGMGEMCSLLVEKASKEVELGGLWRRCSRSCQESHLRPSPISFKQMRMIKRWAPGWPYEDDPRMNTDHRDGISSRRQASSNAIRSMTAR